MKWTYLFVLSFFAFACTSDTEKNPSTSTVSELPKPAVIPIPNQLPELAEITTSVDNLRLRESPGSDGKELMRLPEKSVLMPTGETTELKQQVSLRGLSYKEPWIEVKVDENIKGWIFGGAIDLNPKSSQFAKDLFDTRLKRFFGSSKEELSTYRTLFDNATSASELKLAYEKGLQISEAASKAFGKRCRIADMSMDIDLRWINDAYPGFTPTKVAEGTEIAFLTNINQMIEKAESTPEKDDDEAFKFLKALNGNYSLLLLFRDWFEQTTDYGGVSKLGIGKHFEYLEAAQKLFDDQNVFAEGFIRAECNQIVADIVTNKVGYMRGKDAVLAEIEKIAAANFSFLTEAQKTAIDDRIKQFDNPEENKIYFNERVGKY